MTQESDSLLPETANSSASSRAPQLKPYHFKPGQSGNPNGRPKKLPITEIYEKILGKSKNRKAIEEAIVKTLLAGRMGAVLQLKEMAERVEGKVTQPVELDGSLTMLTLAESISKARKRAKAETVTDK